MDRLTRPTTVGEAQTIRLRPVTAKGNGMGVDDRAPSQPAENNEETPGDYSYDMAHDVAATEHPTRPSDHGVRHGRHASGETPPPDEEGDYSYDLAHEVPPAKD